MINAITGKPYFRERFFRVLHTRTSVTCGFSRSYIGPSMNCRMVLALVSMTHSITILPAEFLTEIEMLSL